MRRQEPPPVSQRLTAPASGGRFTLPPLAVKRSETGESSRESKYGKGASRACGNAPMRLSRLALIRREPPDRPGRGVHRGGDGHLRDVTALDGGRLQTLDFVGNGLEVLVQSGLVEGELADEEAQVAVLVHAELDLAALDVLDGLGASMVTVPVFGFGIRPRGPSTRPRPT